MWEKGEGRGEGELIVRVPGRDAQGYRVRVERGGLDRLGEHCGKQAPAHAYAVIADDRVAERYGVRALSSLRDAGLTARIFTFPPGEASKSRSEWSRLTDRLVEEGYGRDAVVVALGGGVTGDLAGFVAATYMRGIPVVQVPTSLLAMVDSSVGGKTGVDTPRGKNLVGAFHHPSFVLVDPELLSALPSEHVSSGLAEVVKAAAIADETFFGWLDENAARLRVAEPEATAAVVRRAVGIKADVVARDPEEAGLREILNFGHTVGHALEVLRGYDLLHGEAVAAGMRVETRLGQVMGVTEPGTATRVAALLEALGLDGRPEEDVGADRLFRTARLDKKGREGRVRCVLLRRVGQVAFADGERLSHVLPAPAGIEWLASALRPDREGSDS